MSRLNRLVLVAFVSGFSIAAIGSCGGSEFDAGLTGAGGDAGSGPIACQSSKMCPADQVCDTAANECVECLQDDDCANTELCASAHCRPKCDSDEDCAAGSCDTEQGFCIDCGDDAECDAAQFCNDAGECEADLCESGEKQCKDGEFRTCVENGSHFRATLCKVCSDSGQPHCVIGGDSGGAGNGSGGETGEGGEGGAGTPDDCSMETADFCSAIPAYSGDQVVDGKPDDFCDIPSFELDLDNAGYVSPENATSETTRAVIRAAWSDNSFRAHVHVDDPNVLTNDNFYDGDNVQFFLSGYAPVTGNYMSGTEDGGANQVFIRPPSDDDGQISVQWPTTASYDWAARLVSGGYEVELVWTWPVAETMGSVVGFDIIIGVKDSDDTEGRDFEYGLYLGGSGVSVSCAAQPEPSPPAAWCDDTTWCAPTLQ